MNYNLMPLEHAYEKHANHELSGLSQREALKWLER
jgi:hypothetical protein